MHLSLSTLRLFINFVFSKLNIMQFLFLFFQFVYSMRACQYLDYILCCNKQTQKQMLSIKSNLQLLIQKYQQKLETMTMSEEHQQNSQSKVKKSRSAPKKTGSNITGTWLYEQKLAYHLFIFHHYEKFINSALRRCLKLYNMMAKFIGTRTSNQCRTQHHKYVKQYGSVQKVIERLQRFPDHFQKYRIRKHQLEEIELTSFFGVEEQSITKKRFRAIKEQKKQISDVKLEQNQAKQKVLISDRVIKKDNQEVSVQVSMPIVKKQQELICTNSQYVQKSFRDIILMPQYICLVKNFEGLINMNL